MKTLLTFFTVLGMMLLTGVRAQQPAPTPPPINLVLKDGRTITTYSALQRNGNAIMVTVPMGNARGQMGYDVDTITRVEFPEPPQIGQAMDLITAGQLAQGLALLEPVLNYYAPFRDVPGSWWSKAALLKINALMNTGRQSEAAPLIALLSTCKGDPEALNAAAVLDAEAMARNGSHLAALHNLQTVIDQSKDQDILAQAYFYQGESYLALRQFEPAISAYLHIPVFYPDDKVLMPPALLGSARAMIGLQDPKDARMHLEELVKDFPSAPQSEVAKAELEKIEKDQKP